jgi:hypothetical protein
LNILVPRAIQEIESILNDPNSPRALRLKAAQDILNRVPATSIALRQLSNSVGQPQMTANELEGSLQHANEVLAKLPDLQITILEDARRRALQEITQIDEALKQMQHPNGQRAGE